MGQNRSKDLVQSLSNGKNEGGVKNSSNIILIDESDVKNSKDINGASSNTVNNVNNSCIYSSSTTDKTIDKNLGDGSYEASSAKAKRARYRPASPEAIEYHKLTNVNAEKLIPTTSLPSDVISGGMTKVSLPGNHTVTVVEDRDTKDSGAVGDGLNNNSTPKTVIKDAQRYITEQEGLIIGDQRRRMLSQQWRFVLSSDPLQRGLDAGIILASVIAAGMCFANKKYRTQPGKVSFVALIGFVVGTMSVPLATVYLDSINSDRIRNRDSSAMLKQREEYHEKKRKMNSDNDD